MVNTLSNGMPITPATKSAVLDGAQLCFNKAHFNREDFNVDRFVNLARRRATLDQIHNDLRTYLRFLQNSMINLINDDYADFVNLSSTLAVLKDSIDKISSNAESSWTSFSASTEEIQKAAQFVQQKCSTLSSNQRDQIMIRNKIFLLISVERLSKSLRQRPSALSSWFFKLINQVVDVELWSSRIPQEKLPVKAVLAKEACYAHLKTVLIKELVSDLKGNCNFIGMLLSFFL